MDRQLTQFERDMRREFESYLTRIKTVLLEVERRGEVFFDDTIKLSRVFDLINNERMRDAFQARVVRDAEADIDRAVAEMVDWFIHRNLQLWEDVMTFVGGRRKASEARVIGEVGGRFQYDRDLLIRNLSESADEVLSTFDEREESQRLAEGLQGAVVQSGLISIGGVGLGAALVAVLHTLALDVTGVVAGLTIAGLGLLVLPRRRQIAKRDLHNKMQSLRDGLSTSIGGQFESELARATEKLKAAIAPYTRFVKSELERLENLQTDLNASDAEVQRLRREVADLKLRSLKVEARGEREKAS